MQIAKSFVMKPASIVSIHTTSRLVANLARLGLLSNLARWDRPRVHAKIEAMKVVKIIYSFTKLSTFLHTSKLMIKPHADTCDEVTLKHQKNQKLNSPPSAPPKYTSFLMYNYQWLQYKVFSHASHMQRS